MRTVWEGTVKHIITAELLEKLKKAQGLIADVQIALLKADEKLPKDKRLDDWQPLFQIRSRLNEEIYRLRKISHL